MWRHRGLLAVIFLLLLVFMLQYVSRIFFAGGESERSIGRTGSMAVACTIFPFDYYQQAEAGMALLQAGMADSDESLIERSIGCLRRSVALNALYYPARLYLAKALIAYRYPQTPYFNEALSQMKSAARLRPGDLEVALDTSRLLMSMWPFLEAEEKQFTSDLLRLNVDRFSWKEFAPVLELWWYHNKDIEFLLTLLRKNPSLYYPVSQRLIDYRMPLSLRWQFLAAYEYDRWLDASRRYQELALFNPRAENEKKAILVELQGLQGYSELLSSGSSPLKWQQIEDLKKKVLWECVMAVVPRQESELSAARRSEGTALVEKYLELSVPTDHLNELNDYLKVAGFFKPDDMHSLYLKALIGFKGNSLWEVISEVEGLRHSISFVRSEAFADYANLLLTLADAYLHSRLLSQAADVLREMLGQSVNAQETCWRLLKVETIFGAEKAESEAEKKGKEAVRQSRFIVADQPSQAFLVYLLDEPQIEITLADSLRSRLSGYKLFQVFLDDRIVHESYADEVPEKVIIPAGLLRLQTRFRVQIRVI